MRGLATAAFVALLACRAGGDGGAGGGAATAPGAAGPGAGEAGAAAAERTGGPQRVERLALRVVARHPHDPEAFTQGLLWHDGRLWESTGVHGSSSLRRVELASGVVEELAPLPPEVFGEGLALAGGRLFQLTWQEGRAFVWDPSGLALLEEKRYRGEGWGLAWDGERLVQSDGTSWLTFRDPASFAAVGRRQVTLDGRPLARLNELEFAGGALWANLWGSDEIVRIDPATGAVTARVDASALRSEAQAEAARLGRGIDVLNGIAWRPETGTFLLTGKLWPVLFEVEIVPAP